MSEPSIFEGYAIDAQELIPRFEAIDTAQVLGPVLDLLPNPPCRVLDVGAGTGRDAAWLAKRGHQVVAVEPVSYLRGAGTLLHRAENIAWIDDGLPDLKGVSCADLRFDLIVVNAVWQHLRPEQQPRAVLARALLLGPS